MLLLVWIFIFIRVYFREKTIIDKNTLQIYSNLVELIIFIFLLRIFTIPKYF